MFNIKLLFYVCVFPLLTILVFVNCVSAINYSSRHDEIHGTVTRSDIETTREILQLNTKIKKLKKKYSLQEGTEHLLEFGAFLRFQILDTFGFLVYDHYDDFSIVQIEALYKVYHETLERKYNIFDIIPSILKSADIRPSNICRRINENVHTCLKENSKLCINIKKHNQRRLINLSHTPQIYQLSNIQQHFPDGFSLKNILYHLQNNTLKLTPTLLSGLLINAQYDSFDNEVRTAEREFVKYLNKYSENSKNSVLMTSEEIGGEESISGLLEIYLKKASIGFNDPTNFHARVLMKHAVREVETISENIEWFGTIYENNTINLKYLFDLILPSDAVDKDLIEAKKYLLKKTNDLQIVSKYLKIEKYQQTGPDQLLLDIFRQLKDINFTVDIVSALHTQAKFWHKSCNIVNLNDLLDLFSAYDNLRNLEQYREMIVTIDEIRHLLSNSKNISIATTCSNPRACLQNGLQMIMKCENVDDYTKSIIKNFCSRVTDKGSLIKEECPLIETPTQLQPECPKSDNEKPSGGTEDPTTVAENFDNLELASKMDTTTSIITPENDKSRQGLETPLNSYYISPTTIDKKKASTTEETFNIMVTPNPRAVAEIEETTEGEEKTSTLEEILKITPDHSAIENTTPTVDAWSVTGKDSTTENVSTVRKSSTNYLDITTKDYHIEDITKEDEKYTTTVKSIFTVESIPGTEKIVKTKKEPPSTIDDAIITATENNNSTDKFQKYTRDKKLVNQTEDCSDNNCEIEESCEESECLNKEKTAPCSEPNCLNEDRKGCKGLDCPSDKGKGPSDCLGPDCSKEKKKSCEASDCSSEEESSSSCSGPNCSGEKKNCEGSDCSSDEETFYNCTERNCSKDQEKGCEGLDCLSNKKAAINCSGPNCSDEKKKSCKGSDCSSEEETSASCSGPNCSEGKTEDCKGSNCLSDKETSFNCTGTNCSKGIEKICIGVDCSSEEEASTSCSGPNCSEEKKMFCKGSDCSNKAETSSNCIGPNCSEGEKKICKGPDCSSDEKTSDICSGPNCLKKEKSDCNGPACSKNAEEEDCKNSTCLHKQIEKICEGLECLKGDCPGGNCSSNLKENCSGANCSDNQIKVTTLCDSTDPNLQRKMERLKKIHKLNAFFLSRNKKMNSDKKQILIGQKTGRGSFGQNSRMVREENFRSVENKRERLEHNLNKSRKETKNKGFSFRKMKSNVHHSLNELNKEIKRKSKNAISVKSNSQKNEKVFSKKRGSKITSRRNHNIITAFNKDTSNHSINNANDAWKNRHHKQRIESNKKVNTFSTSESSKVEEQGSEMKKRKRKRNRLAKVNAEGNEDLLKNRESLLNENLVEERGKLEKGDKNSFENIDLVNSKSSKSDSSWKNKYSVKFLRKSNHNSFKTFNDFSHSRKTSYDYKFPKSKMQADETSISKDEENSNDEDSSEEPEQERLDNKIFIEFDNVEDSHEIGDSADNSNSQENYPGDGIFYYDEADQSAKSHMKFSSWYL